MRAINHLYFNAFVLLSGMLAPLSLYPSAVQTLAWLLPWRWTIYFPVQLLLGQLSLREAASGFGMQILWIGIAAMIAQFVWKKSILRFASVGG